LVTPNEPTSAQVFDLSGSIKGDIRGIDYRPANGLVYAVTSKNQFYSINITTGAVVLVSTMDKAFKGGDYYSFDFNPTVDKARLIGANKENARYNVDTGALLDFNANKTGIQIDRTLRFATSSDSDKEPFAVGAAYTNSFSPAPNTTVLYVLEKKTGRLYTQSPPNNGILNRVGGKVGITLPNDGSFDIYTNRLTLNSTAIFGTSSGQFYTIDLVDGEATRIWRDYDRILSVAGGDLVGLTIIPSSA